MTYRTDVLKTFRQFWRAVSMCAVCVLLLLSCVNTACFGQTVVVRIVNAKNERPMRNRPIYIFGISGKVATDRDERYKLITKHISPDLKLMSDANGEAQFQLPKPAPVYFYVRAVLSGPRWDCTCLLRVATVEVMQKGFMVRSPWAEHTRTGTSIQPKPGEVLFALRAMPWWLQVLYPLAKG